MNADAASSVRLDTGLSKNRFIEYGTSCILRGSWLSRVIDYNFGSHLIGWDTRESCCLDSDVRYIYPLHTLYGA